MPVGWFQNVAEADDYFQDERLETTYWDALTDSSGHSPKTKALMMAYNRIYYSKEFIVPTYAEASAANLVILKKAQAEMAYYLAQHLADEDARKGLQAQGVTDAGVVKERYAMSATGGVLTDELHSTPIPQIVRDMLCTFLSGTDTPFFAVDIDRDEDYPTDEDVTDLL